MDSITIKEKKWKGISGSTIKIIAMITMLIDHFGATWMLKRTRVSIGFSNYQKCYDTYMMFRLIGRIAFPIYIFLLIEGFEHTRSKLKYFIRLCIFAILSEMSFDVAFNDVRIRDIKNGRLIETTSQNVFFTLALGFLAIMCIDYIYKRLEKKNLQVLVIFAFIAVGLLCGCAAEFLKTDYDSAGIVAILIMYALRKYKMLGMAGTVLALTIMSSSLEIYAIIDVLFVYLYNGKRGLKLKWIFYIYYPLHLFILGYITYNL